MKDKLYPLAAMCQAAQLALQLAKMGHCDESLLQTQVESLFIFDPKTASHVYGNDLDHLGLGLAYLNFAAQNPWKAFQGASFPLLRSFCKIAQKILHSPELQKKLFSQLSRIHEQISYFGSWQHPRVTKNLTDLYLELANSVRLRLHISGHKDYLQNVEMVNKIRVILFSGVRAAVLWYQMKGNLLWLICHRKQILLASQKTVSKKDV